MSNNSKAWADNIISDIQRVRAAAVGGGANSGVSPADAERIIAALIQAVESRTPEAVRLTRKMADLNSVYSKRAA